jgi:hypothetical protein
MSRASHELLMRLYDLATGDEDAHVCGDIPEAACRHQPHNHFTHVLALVSLSAAIAALRLPEVQ